MASRKEILIRRRKATSFGDPDRSVRRILAGVPAGVLQKLEMAEPEKAQKHGFSTRELDLKNEGRPL